MSIQELKGEIDRKSQEEISAVLENAKKEAENIITQANTKAEALKIEKERSIARESEAKERAELATIRIDRKGELLRKRSELCDRVFDEAEKRITQIAESAGPEYRDFIVKLTVQGITALNGTKFVVQANSKDVAAIQNELKTIQTQSTQIKKDDVVVRVASLPSDTMGGVLVSLEDGTQSYNNLLDARFLVVKRNVAFDVNKTLFGEETE